MAEKHIIGSILGTAVGDALGLPYEGLPRHRAAKLFGPPDRHRLFFGRGMVSDDTEHTCMVAQALIASGGDIGLFRRSLGLSEGVSGYVYHSVPVAIHAWFAHPRDFRSALVSVLRCGGDTDSTGAIVGGIVGAAVGKDGIPADWLDGLFEWPRSVPWMERLTVQLGSTLDSGTPARPVKLPVWGVLFRNLFFLLIVLGHGFRRLFPPY
jgi:ADP-ribosylglycohydrolase